MTLLGMELTDDFDKDIVDFLTKYIDEFEEVEELQDKNELKSKPEEVSLTDISKMDSGEEEKRSNQ